MKNRKFGLSLQYGGILFLLLSLIGFSLSYLHSKQQAIENEKLSKAFDLLLEESLQTQLEQNARLIAQNLVSQLPNAIAYAHYSKIKKIISKNLNLEQTSYIYIYDKEGNILHDGSSLVKPFNQSINLYLPDFLKKQKHFKLSSILKDNSVHIAMPIYGDYQGEKLLLGGVRFSIHFPLIEQGIERFNETMDNNQSKIIAQFRKENLTLFFIFALLSIVVSVLIGRRMSKPIVSLSLATKQIEQGNYKVKIDKINQRGELADLSVSLENMCCSLDSQVEKIKFFAFLDELTKLPNRKLLVQDLNALIKKKQQGCLLKIDIDSFGRINKQYGNRVGDLFLIKASQLFNRVCEVMIDSDIDYKMYRSGSDEFDIIVQCDVDSASALADKLNQHYTDLYINGYKLSLDIHLGIFSFSDKDISSSQIITCAELALKEAKLSTQTKVCLFQTELMDSVNNKSQLLESLYTAIDQSLFFLNYQPIVCLDNQSVITYEALIRLKVDDKFISPADFIPLAEEMHCIDQITYFVIEKVCQDLASCKSFDKRVSINISGQLIDRSDFYLRVISILEHYKIDCTRIALEVTETSMVKSFEQAIEGIIRFKKAGFMIYLDDFGSGYSSLSYLQKLPIDVVKLDKDLVQGVLENSRYFDSIVALCYALDLRIIIEGVETAEQLALCRKSGCGMIQGYHLSKPLLWQDARQWVYIPES
ncbi:bifunctional diguanylate cyclase/phosphodiesterase [Psychromonas sp. Urea-02u-13]|uniref:bifunctional diguanylate cyclase/phosphodiesterase n=1 Tax=Psychromonas sp. Urea-02u-13 TaxID=2058326 RepID=UPI0018E29957|nr:GGDEF domain-containing phosphodiesterase [Psychromonas sp. Urea-02u-13]